MRFLFLALMLAASSAQAADVYLTCETTSTPDTTLNGHRKWYASPPATTREHLANLADLGINKVVWSPSTTYVIELDKKKVTATDENRQQVFEIELLFLAEYFSK